MIIRLSCICLLSLSAMSLFWEKAIPAPLPTEKQQLIVFTQTADRFFIADCLPKIQKLTQEKGIELVLKNAELGAPEEISTTPAIIYQNAAGRSIYAARYAEFATIENFIRTSRVVPQQKVLNCKQQVLVQQQGRMQVAVPVKITALGGPLPANFDTNGFNQKALEAIDKGLSAFKITAESCLSKTDRAFYLDFHPYRSSDDQLYLSIEMFSQFSCVKPVFSKLTTPLKGSFSEFEALFAQAGLLLEQEIAQQMQDSKIGDAVTPLTLEVPKMSFDQLGLALPRQENGDRAAIAAIDGVLPLQWELAGPLDRDIPMVQFRFPEPLDRYAGEMAEFSGMMNTDDQHQIASGSFTVNTESLTMGMEDLDVKVRKKYIYSHKFPTSTFRFTAIPKATVLKWGQTTSTDIEGEFQLMKTRKNITVKADLTPTRDAKGTLLAVQASFSLNITDDFGIEGPDGPAPAKKTLLFNLNFYMKPKG